MPQVTQYEQTDGIVPFKKWFDSLGAKAALKVRTAIALQSHCNRTAIALQSHR